jgi:hypothetical protein
VSVHVAFDIYPAATPNGSLLVRLLASGTGTKQAVELSARKVLHGSGEGMIRIHSSHAAATSANFTKRNYVKVVLVNGATETEWFGFFMEQGDFGAISRREQAGRMLTFSGPGSLFYLDRALLLAEIYAPGQPRRGNLQLDGQWGWNDIPYGAIMTRAMEEGYYAPGNPLFYATWDFSRTEDSAAVAWPNIDNEFTVPWGTSVYDLIASFIKLGLVVTVDADLTFHAWQTYGTNRTSATFAAGKIRFAHGVNIGNEVTRQIRASLERSHIFVVGDEFTSAVVSGGSSAVTYYDTLQKQETNDGATLTAAGDRDLAQREIQSDAAFPVRVILDDDELNGLYVPGEHYDVGDIATIHTVPPSGASGEHDFTNFAIEVAAIKVEHDDAGNWFAVNELGAQYLSAQLSALEVPSSKIIHQIELCRPMTPSAASCAIDPSQMTEVSTPNGDFELGNTSSWDGAVLAGPGSYAETSAYASTVNTLTPQWRYTGWVGQTFTSGQTYVFRFYVLGAGALRVRVGDVAVDGSSVSGDFEEWTAGSGATLASNNWALQCLEWTPSANRTAVRLVQDKNGAHGELGIDQLQAYTGGFLPGDGHAALIGTSIRAKRCDDTEHYHTTGDPTVNDDVTLGFRNGTMWINESTGEMFLLLDNTDGAADWLAVGGTGSGGVVVEDEGTPLATTATTLDFVGAGVTATGAGATKTITIPGNANPPWLIDANAAPYGAVPDDATDATTAITDACADAVAAAIVDGGNKAVVELDPGIYEISGAVLTTTGHYSQIILPIIAATSPKVTLVIRSKHHQGVGWSDGAATSATKGDVILHSTLTGQTYSGSDGWPAIIGTVQPENTSTVNNLLVHLQGISFRQAPNPSLACFHFWLLRQAIIEDCRFDTTDVVSAGITEPTNVTGVVGWMPFEGNNAVAEYRGLCQVIGYYGGFPVAEHTKAEKIAAYRCKVAVNMQALMFHAAELEHVSAEHCTYVIASVGTTGLVTPGSTGDYCIFTITLLDIEDATSGWAAPVEHINDAGDLYRGTIQYIRVIAGTGTTSGPLTVTGCTNVAMIDLADPDFGGPDLSGINFLVGTASGLLSAEIAVGATPGGELGGTWASPTVDVTHSGSAHLALGSSSSTAAAGDHTHTGLGGIGPILITDTPAGSPLVFADLLQTEEGDDLLYADV